MVASALFGSNFTVLRINVIFARGCGLVSCHFGFDADGRPVSSNHKEDARKNWWAGILLGIFGEIKTFIDFENTSAIEIPYGGAQKHTARCMPQ